MADYYEKTKETKYEIEIQYDGTWWSPTLPFYDKNSKESSIAALNMARKNRPDRIYRLVEEHIVTERKILEI